jgi:pimeloyl-ACP methyl ester carboxylesterase
MDRTQGSLGRELSWTDALYTGRDSVRASERHEWDRVPVVISFAEQLRMTETYGFSGSQGRTVLEGQRLLPRGRPSDTVYLFMHPTSTLQLLPMPMALADAGLHVLCAGSRYAKNDSALIMEKVALDLGAYIRHAREDLGYRKVVLVGWSGGGSLSLFYQAQAEAPSIVQTPAGDPCDLVGANLPRADGIVFIAAHLSRAETMTEWLDPSINDELRPDDRDLELDIYAPHCPHAPPFDAAFVARFREAQRARNRKITNWALDMLDFLRRKDDGEMERAFVVHRTMCDVRWIDPSIDPNDRKPNWTYLGDPRIVNAGPAGLARFTTLRSWLSQWSYDLSNAKGPANAARIRGVPVLQIENTADDAVPATHNPAIRDALGTQDKEFVRIEGATHYYLGQPDLLQRCIATVIDWSARKGLLGDPPR